jgi:hypothetical protein
MADMKQNGAQPAKDLPIHASRAWRLSGRRLPEERAVMEHASQTNNEDRHSQNN